ncbi:hypothetical protein [Caulobacter mirabilis]|uniref:Uncharacterized protein n=1 Tax=Caulobacter mirabilis TaxID=69666 RepID=A0A2D2AT61_9CAUL|nr:hypothetical protein [Caulobacter mirabilis]ATQ41198.1 hypothetical protein CSW64_01610 [Caulobacter mirabilis]
MPDTNAVAAEKAKKRDILNAGIVVAICVVLGGFMFQSASLSFEYMKLRDLRLYMSASSLEGFARRLETVRRDIDARDAPALRGLIGARGTIDIDLYNKKEAADRAISNAKTALRRNLSPDQKAKTKYAEASLTFAGIDKVFDAICRSEDNDRAANAGLPLEGADVEEAPSAAPAPPTAPALSPELRRACDIPDNFCPQDATGAALPSTGGERAQMICTQLVYQSAVRKKTAVSAFAYDSAKALGDSLAISYPDFKPEQAGAAIKIVEAYTSLAPRALKTPPAPGANPSAGQRVVTAFGDFASSFWNVLLSWPLAITYLLLAFLFGGLGSLSRYLYYYANPRSENPTGGVLHNVLAGGGGAVLVLLIVMAGFQFLTVGASAPDLAYPNPLTVSAISVLSGLGGERVLETLNGFIGRVFGAGASGDQAGGGGNAAGGAARRPPSPPPPPPPGRR